MRVTVMFDGEPKEIAALALELRKQHECVKKISPEELAEKLNQHLQDRIEQGPTWS